ncbi:MAG: hypothetical protein OQK51_21810 [Kangiellaceae bacterium]|nr:hypothetical protein [Kangiellaceae bacterium]
MKKILILLLTCMSLSAHASYTCTGQVTGVSISPSNGKVLVEKIGDLIWVELCSVQSSHNNVEPETCKNIYSLLISAQLSKKEVMLWFNDEDQGMNCSNHPRWRPLTGWYFGPSIQG